MDQAPHFIPTTGGRFRHARSSVQDRIAPAAAAMRATRRGAIAVLTAMATLIAAVALILLPAAPAHAAPLSSTPLITYNMQGRAASSTSAKWTTDVGPYIRAAEIVAVQEAGPAPPGVQATPPTQIPALAAVQRLQVGMGSFVQHHRWTFGRESYEVYFLQTDQNGGTYTGGRVNTGLVTQRQADQVTAVPNPNPNGRAALGVRFDNDWYFSFHALSMGPGVQNDSAGMLAAIDAHVAMVPGRQWTVMGDFNTDPDDLRNTIPAGSRIYSSGQATQQSGNELDYAVSSTRIQNHPVRRRNGASADHYAVAVGALRAAAEPRETLFHSPRVIDNMRYGGALETEGLSFENDAPITISSLHISPHTASDYQEWDILFNNTDTVQIQLEGGRCIEAFLEGKRGTLAYRMRLRDCSNDVKAQEWKLVSLGNEQYQIRNVEFGWCMAIITPNGIQVGQPSGPPVDLMLIPCRDDDDSQHWLLTPSYHPDAAPDFDVPDLAVAYDSRSGLENARTGRMLAHGLDATFSPPRTYPHGATSTTTEEAWHLRWLSFGSVQLGNGEVCLNLGSPDNDTGVDYGVVWTRCSDAPSMFWEVMPTGENTFALVNSQPTDTGAVCLDERPEDPPSHSPVDSGIIRATPCTSSPTPTQRWFFAPFSTSSPPVEVTP
jgi:Cytolethal distending toxin A/C domain